MKMRTLTVISLVILSLALAACTRQASTAPVPTNPAALTAPGAVPSEDQTMAAVRSTAAVLATQAVAGTQTAVKGSGGGGEKSTPGAKEVASATPAGQVPAATAVPVATAVPAATAVPTAIACANPYTVKQGDWIYKIARDCKMNPAAILAANPGISANFITPGQKLNLPTGAAATETSQAGCTGKYTVVMGDTLFHIAYRCGMTTEQLASVNGIRYPFVIHPGDVLKFP